jgi:hypothetical protein
MTPIDADRARACAIASRREELLTVKEYASVMRLHVRSVYRRISEGRQPGLVRAGRDLRIDLPAATRSSSAAGDP